MNVPSLPLCGTSIIFIKVSGAAACLRPPACPSPPPRTRPAIPPAHCPMKTRTPAGAQFHSARKRAPLETTTGTPDSSGSPGAIRGLQDESGVPVSMAAQFGGGVKRRLKTTMPVPPVAAPILAPAADQRAALKDCFRQKTRHNLRATIQVQSRRETNQMRTSSAFVSQAPAGKNPGWGIVFSLVLAQTAWSGTSQSAPSQTVILRPAPAPPLRMEFDYNFQKALPPFPKRTGAPWKGNRPRPHPHLSAHPFAPRHHR